MKKHHFIFGILAIAAALGLSGQSTSDGPEFTSDGQLRRPANYREWIFLSSGLGMTYAPAAAQTDPAFDNVFVSRAAYQAFMKSGNWPDQTIFVLEARASQSEGSINKGGHFQTDVKAVEVHVKDEARFPGKWAFFAFAAGSDTAKQIPLSATCYSCHSQNGAVDTTFVQFYPTLIQLAKEKGTFAAPR